MSMRTETSLESDHKYLSNRHGYMFFLHATAKTELLNDYYKYLFSLVPAGQLRFVK